MQEKKYIDSEALKRDLIDNRSFYPSIVKAAIESAPAADVVEVVRCKDCTHHIAGYCTREINGRTNMFRMGNDDFCSYGAKMDGKGCDDDKPKTTCLNCKHLMVSDMYGECGLQLRIVRPSDTCEYAEPKDGRDGEGK